MTYGKTLEEIKALRLAEQSGLHNDTTKMVTAAKPKATRKSVAKKPKK